MKQQAVESNVENFNERHLKCELVVNNRSLKIYKQQELSNSRRVRRKNEV
jgi:hypothetical protein